MTTYRIKKGDTLSGIARRYGTSVSALAKANHLRNANVISAGRTLTIPGHSSASSFTPAKKTTRTHAAAPVKGGSGAKGSSKLAAAGRRAALSIGGYRSRGLCATGVSRAIRAAYGITVRGNGNQIDNNLPRRKFKQVHMTLAQALKTPGLILTWEHTSTRLGRIYGHTAITAGDGHTSYSDFIERNTHGSGRTGLKIFAPI